MTQCQSNLILLAFGEAWMNILSIFSRKMSHGSFTCMLQHSKPTKTRANWYSNIIYTKDNIYQLPVHKHYIPGVRFSTLIGTDQ